MLGRDIVCYVAYLARYVRLEILAVEKCDLWILPRTSCLTIHLLLSVSYSRLLFHISVLL